jgi:tetratricopeptide (TPR) repeat protein
VILLAMGVSAAAAAQPAEVAARSRAASEAMQAGRFDEAAGIYRQLVEAMPREAGLLMNLGMALAMAGREREAVEPLRRALAIDATLLPAHLFLGSSYLALGEPRQAIAPLERVVAAQPREIDHRRMLARAYSEDGRLNDAVAQLRRVTELAPALPAAWYALGHAYNAVTQEALGSFEREPEDSAWRRLLVADALAADGRLTDAFALYRQAGEALPDMPLIAHAVARLYEKAGHPEWAGVERRKAGLPPAACAKRRAACEFLAGRHRSALGAAAAGEDPESRYVRARAAAELALSAFERLDALPDSRERREVRAALARNERRYLDAVKETEAALGFAPRDPALLDDLGTALYLAREYGRAADVLKPLVERSPDARLLAVYGDSLLQLQRVDEAVPVLRRAVQADSTHPAARLALGRAYALQGEHAAALPLLHSQLAADADGSVHAQAARSYAALGEKDKAAALLERSQALQRSQQERDAAVAQRAITPPK